MSVQRSRLRAILGRTQVLRTRLIIIASALALLCVAACSNEEPTQTSTSNEIQPTSAPAVTVELPTPTPTPAPTGTPTPTPIAFSVTLPLPPTRTPQPTPTPDPNAPTAPPLPDIESMLPTPRIKPQSLLLDDGRVLFTGGTLILLADTGQIEDLLPHPFLEIYDPATRAWSLVQPLNWNLVDVSVAPLHDGNLLVLALQKPEDE